jgi:hypothetical protein
VTGWLWFALVASVLAIGVSVAAITVSVYTIRLNNRATRSLERTNDTPPDQGC